jgi:hypothetical protein
MREKSLCDGTHSMGNRGYLFPQGYLHRSGKCENIGDPGKEHWWLSPRDYLQVVKM